GLHARRALLEQLLTWVARGQLVDCLLEPLPRRRETPALLLATGEVHHRARGRLEPVALFEGGASGRVVLAGHGLADVLEERFGRSGVPALGVTRRRERQSAQAPTERRQRAISNFHERRASLAPIDRDAE